MIRDHKFYEMQSALAVAGQLSDAELAELEQHANDCVSCSECIADMAEMSREFFLVHARRASSNGTPAGMQERFLERAASSGIPVSCSVSRIPGPQFARAAVFAVFLAIFLSVGWKVSSFRGLETAAVRNTPTSEIPSVRAVEGTQVVQKLSASGAQSRRRSTVRSAVVLIPSAQSIQEDRHSYLNINRPLLAKHDLPTFSPGNPTHPSSTKEYVASLFGRDRDNKPDESAFHYDFKLASVSLLESSPGADSEPHVTSVKFNIPIFHPDPNWAW